MSGWVTHDLSTFINAHDIGAVPSVTSTAQYSGGLLAGLTSSASSLWPFVIPALVLAPAKVNLVEITFQASGQDPFTGYNAVSLLSLASINPAVEPSVTDDQNLLLSYSDPTISGAVFTYAVGPDGGSTFDTDVTGLGYYFLLFYVAGIYPADPEPVTRIAQIRSMVVEGALPPLTTPGIPALRQYPRTDGLGASTAPRLWPPPRSVQASNRRAGGYL